MTTASEDEVIVSYTAFMRLPLGSKIRARNGVVYEHTEKVLGVSHWRAEDGGLRTSNNIVLPVTLVHRG